MKLIAACGLVVLLHAAYTTIECVSRPTRHYAR
jgi:hypothetical protein